MAEKNINLFGRIFIESYVHTVTGLHIGGSSTGMEIGGVDNPVIRNQINNQPYIPGSSLRGKMRSQLEKVLGLPQNNRIGAGVHIHTCEVEEEYENCIVCKIFGLSGRSENDPRGPARLIVRDAMLSNESFERLRKANTDLAFTELKTEVAIDRVTSAASPRNLERVPAGATFGPLELVFSIYEKEADLKRFKRVLEGMQLIEDDYLGGSGSRGSGKVAFKEIALTFRSSDNYGNVQAFEQAAKFESVQQVIEKFDVILAWVRPGLEG